MTFWSRMTYIRRSPSTPAYSVVRSPARSAREPLGIRLGHLGREPGHDEFADGRTRAAAICMVPALTQYRSLNGNAGISTHILAHVNSVGGVSRDRFGATASFQIPTSRAQRQNQASFRVARDTAGARSDTSQIGTWGLISLSPTRGPEADLIPNPPNALGNVLEPWLDI